jgi:hypothetical protein
MTHALAGLGTHNVRVEENVSDIVHVNPSPSTCHISSATGHRAAWCTVRENKLYLFHIQPVQGLQQGTNISV